jgi:cytochrome c553
LTRLVKDLATFVFDGLGRFLKEEAVLGMLKVDSASTEFTRNRLVIRAWLCGKQGELESTSPGSASVAIGRGTSVSGKDRSDLVSEIGTRWQCHHHEGQGTNNVREPNVTWHAL